MGNAEYLGNSGILMVKKCILYLRTDICDEELIMGGSVGHTVGVINGFIQQGYDVVCASSCMLRTLKTIPLVHLLPLQNPSSIKFLRWKINSLLSSLFFFFQARKLVLNHSIVAIYQRYSLLNITGVLLAWWYKKKLILEYNGSEAWIVLNWGVKKRFFSGALWMYGLERINLSCADSIVVVSEVLKQELIERGIASEKILVNPNGVDPLIFTHKHQKMEYL